MFWVQEFISPALFWTQVLYTYIRMPLMQAKRLVEIALSKWSKSHKDTFNAVAKDLKIKQNWTKSGFFYFKAFPIDYFFVFVVNLS